MSNPSPSTVQSWAAANGASSQYDLRFAYAFAAVHNRVPANSAELASYTAGLQQSYGVWAPAYAAYLTANEGFPPDQGTWNNWLAANGVTDPNHVPAPGAGYQWTAAPAGQGSPPATFDWNDPFASVQRLWRQNDQNKVMIVGAGLVGYMFLANRRRFF